MKWVWLLVLAAALGLMYFLQHQGTGQSSSDFVFRQVPRPLPQLAAVDGDGRTMGALDDAAGKFVLLNVWATWCVPCRKEMPTLDRLREQLGGPDFAVIALSVDKGGVAAVRRFYAEIGIRSLPVRVAANPDGVLTALGAYGLPTTLLIDRQGREVARLIGPANWDSKDMIGFLKEKIAAGK